MKNVSVGIKRLSVGDYVYSNVFFYLVGQRDLAAAMVCIAGTCDAKAVSTAFLLCQGDEHITHFFGFPAMMTAY